jgi:tetratricopeptide (TPR) repeat protein
MRKSLLLAAVALLLGTHGCQRSEKAKSALDWAGQAADLRKADKKEEAVKAYDEAIKLDPNLEEAIFNRALIYAELGRDDEAVAARDNLLTRKSPLGKRLQGFLALNSDANVSFGNKHLQAGEWDLAQKKYKVALIYDGDSSGAHVGLGLACIGQKKYDEAVAHFDRAIQLDAKSAIAHHNRGIANRERKQFQLAVADFTRAVELEPENPQGYEGRATAYDGLDDKAKAEDDRKKAAELKNQKKVEVEKN